LFDFSTLQPQDAEIVVFFHLKRYAVTPLRRVVVMMR